ncbi:hypothetical protein Syun_006624 [Stephania yunnanensis]|uniref:Uncharacterized protein n=1 Tax=Stephania yunnanensis TaxID=152371 RepID=A0AAP0PXT1_9MAGN
MTFSVLPKPISFSLSTREFHLSPLIRFLTSLSLFLDKSSLLTLGDSLTTLTICLSALGLTTILSASLDSGGRRCRGLSSTTK